MLIELGFTDCDGNEYGVDYDLDVRFNCEGWHFQVDVENLLIIPLDMNDNLLYDEQIPLSKKTANEFVALYQELYDYCDHCCKSDGRVFIPNISRFEFTDIYGDTHYLDSRNIYMSFTQRIPLSDEGLMKFKLMQRLQKSCCCMTCQNG